jgi:GNAT superfamily N-acetyltransferase
MDEVLAATQADLFWLPEHVTRLERADVLALHDGTSRDLHNQVVRAACPESEAADLVAEIDAFHTGCSQWLVVPTTPMAALEKHLPRRGYVPRFEGDAFTLSTDSKWVSADVRVVVVHDLATLRDNREACHRGFERGPQGNVDWEADLRMCTEPGARTARFVAYDSAGAPIGSANINRYDALSFGFLWAGAVVPEARGRGVYGALLAARARWAKVNGLANIGLYANRSTSGPVVERMGFEKHGPMTYWHRAARSTVAAGG